MFLFSRQLDAESLSKTIYKLVTGVESEKYPTRLRYVFKTDVDTSEKMESLKRIFSRLPSVKNWSIDSDDKDKVLVVDSISNELEDFIIESIMKEGILCEPLED